MQITKILILMMFMFVSIHSETILCDKCRETRNYILDLLIQFKEYSFPTIIDICGFFILPEACNFYIKGLGNPMVFNSLQFLKDSDSICSTLFCLDDDLVKLKIEDLQNYLDKTFPKKQIFSDRTSEEDIEIIVVNDLHLQKDYKENTLVECGQVAGCCTPEWGNPGKNQTPAGYWGTRVSNCDIPIRTFDRTLSYIKGKYKITN